MTRQEVIAALEAVGTAQNRKVYARHGVGKNMYGVSYANLNKFKRRIKKDHTLAVELWATGNHDARILATMIDDPVAVTDEQIEGWLKDLDNYVITDAFSKLVSQTALARQKSEQWQASPDEWIGRAAWNLVAQLAMKEDRLQDAYFEKCLATIKDEIHERKNRVRDAMNSALIAIGIRNSELQDRALSVAAAIGKVEVDHGKTSCKTPDAAEYIRKTLARRALKGK